ncbi:hypothetical protein F5878DRAFT_713972 [Lentinula raphanica]|uniref:Vps72/YL1 C-terminal domain-containing protein n=1 Tax=Lentinula raphanica TaxID=153919 RepID=A0AA38NVX0_9AGAR|nr:hypothetical protein F5878DRAFT_713972 [Lentinula raphanica]
MQIFRLYARWNSARLFLLFFALVCISSVAALPIPSVKARSQTANTYLHYDLTAFATSTAVPANKRNEVEGHTKKGLLAKLQSEGYETLILAPAIKGEPKFIEVGDKKLVGFGAFVKAKKKDAAPGPLELLQEEVKYVGTMELNGDGSDLSLVYGLEEQRSRLFDRLSSTTQRVTPATGNESTVSQLAKWWLVIQVYHTTQTSLKLKGQGFNVQEHLPEGALKRHRRTTTSLVVSFVKLIAMVPVQTTQLFYTIRFDSSDTILDSSTVFEHIYTSAVTVFELDPFIGLSTASTSGSTSESASATIAIPTTVLPTITHTKGPRYDLSSLPMASGYRLPSPPTSAPTSAPFPVRTSPSANEPGLEKSMKHIKHRIKKVAKSYLIHELSQDDGESPKLSWDQTMDALFGDHVQWREVTEGVFVHEESATRYIPTCRITGLPAKYLDPRTGLPFANLWAYRILRRLAGEVLSPPSSKGELPSDGNRGVGLGGDDNGSPTTADDADFECHGEIGVWDEDLGCYVGDWESTGTVSRGVVDS